MKTKIMGIITVVLVLGFAGTAEATIVDVSVATNKLVYELGEDVVVFVIAYNPNPEPITLTGGFYFASYKMDGVYDWAEGRCTHPTNNCTCNNQSKGLRYMGFDPWFLRNARISPNCWDAYGYW